MEYRYINLTDHDIRIADGVTDVVIPPSGMIARIKSKERRLIGIDAGIKQYLLGGRQIEHLPAPAPGTIYIVSKVVLAALNGRRKDVYAPERVKRKDGQVISAQGLVRFERVKKQGMPIAGGEHYYDK
ncbi:hypothetical protein [Culicoidibacter larvae]|uniref:Uncharacterized protein n=1 Tax=Culicoidibacter larvae TaxID=2579976 RepID=A0A5R8Q789_9FIRM|nr:hypothetical protein [Culicoidibacter larvae]TLG71279.1 hypothetical protein FEZ08_11050 [Culicoidibacter larvae]